MHTGISVLLTKSKCVILNIMEACSKLALTYLLVLEPYEGHGTLIHVYIIEICSLIKLTVVPWPT